MRRVAVLASVLVVCGCAHQKATISSFTEPSFSPSSMRSVAVLPIRNARLAPSDAQQVNRRIAQVLAASGQTVLGGNEAIEKLNAAALSDEWATFLANFTSSGVPNSASLNRIATGLGVDGILQGELINTEQTDGRTGILGNRGRTRVTIRYCLLDGRSGLLVWEATADGVSTTGTKLEAAPAVIEAINLAMDKIIEMQPFHTSQATPPTGP